jgi:alkylation response protein AidB-like acyl-CoA dehydrogenase
MKGTVSYLVRFEQTFIPKENLIGYPGQYILEEWQTRFTPQYGAAFLGAAEGAYEYALAYIKKQEKGHDPTSNTGLLSSNEYRHDAFLVAASSHSLGNRSGVRSKTSRQSRPLHN